MSAATRSGRSQTHRPGHRTPLARPRPRRTRKSERRKLNHKRAREFDRTRALPDDMPIVRNDGHPDEYAPVPGGVFNRCERWLVRTGFFAQIEVRLHGHTSPPSALPVKAVLMGMILAIYKQHSYRRTDVCAVLCGFDASQARRVGLCDAEGRRVPFSYEMVQTQVKRIEDELRKGWKAPSGSSDSQRTGRDLRWFALTAVEHCIPEEHKPLINKVALDSTAVKGWANDQVFGSEEKLQEALKTHPPTPRGEVPPIGSNGRFGRVRRSKCPDALPAYTADGIVTGFDVHMVTAIRDALWGGDPHNIWIGDSVPPYILAVLVMPGMAKYALSGVRALKFARKNAPNADEVIADIGYTQHPRFLSGARHNRYSPTIDYKSEPGNKDKPNQKVHTVRIGTAGGGETVLMNNGVLIPMWTPPEWQRPPADLKGDKLAEWLAKRYNRVGYVCIEQNDDGSRRMQCPQCAGKIRTTARTRSNAQKAQPRQPKHRTKSTPGPKPRPIPMIKIHESFEYCCGGVRTIRPKKATDKLIHYQDIPHKTPPWTKWYGYRNPSENTNSRAKTRNLLTTGWCRTLGLAATTVGAVLTAVALNLKITKDQHRKQQPDPDSPESRLATAVDRSPTITHKNDPSEHNDDEDQPQNPADTEHRSDVAARSDDRAPP